jgi:hypothetical protein
MDATATAVVTSLGSATWWWSVAWAEAVAVAGMTNLGMAKLLE